MTENIIQKKSCDFALQIVALYKVLSMGNEFVLSRQILGCGTSIGANVKEAIGGHSRKDLFWKISIAYMEARETHYWIRLLSDSGFINEKNKNELITNISAQFM